MFDLKFQVETIFRLNYRYIVTVSVLLFWIKVINLCITEIL